MHPPLDSVTIQVPQPAKPALADDEPQRVVDVGDMLRRHRAAGTLAPLVSQCGDIGFNVLDNGRVGVLGDVHFGLCHDAGFDFLGTGFERGEHGPRGVKLPAPRRHSPNDAVAVPVLCRVGAGPFSNTGRVAGRRRCLAFLAAGVSPHGDTLAGSGAELCPLGQRPGDERLENTSHTLAPFTLRLCRPTAHDAEVFGECVSRRQVNRNLFAPHESRQRLPLYAGRLFNGVEARGGEQGGPHKFGQAAGRVSCHVGYLTCLVGSGQVFSFVEFVRA